MNLNRKDCRPTVCCPQRADMLEAVESVVGMQLIALAP
jgi:hypothetical protein